MEKNQSVSPTEPGSGRIPGNLRVNRSTRRSLAIAATVGGVFAVLIVLASMWVGYRVSTAGSELKSMSQLVPQLKDEIVRGDEEAASSTVSALNRKATRAKEAASDPFWAIAESIPWLGPNFQAAREAATAASDVITLGATPLVKVLGTLDWQSLSPSKNGVDLAPLAAAEPHLTVAANAVSQSAERLNRIDTSVLIPQVSVPLEEARQQLHSLEDGLETAADAAELTPQMLGLQGPKSYLLLIQNNAETRATGGIPGALAVLNIDKGKLSLGSQTSATAMGSFTPILAVDQEQTRIYSGRMGKFMQDVNLTPDFPTAAQTAQGMWFKETGQRLDGVLAIDPIALSYVLGVTGPVELGDSLVQAVSGNGMPETLTARNVVPTLLSDVYTKITDPALQDEYFASVAKEVFSKLSAGSGKPIGLVNAVTRGAQERRILLWSAQSDEQAVISRYRIGGGVTGPGIAPAQFGVYFNDGTGAKMDYHVKRSVQLIKDCPAGGYRQIKVRVTSTNTVSREAALSLPEYVTGGGTFGIPVGSVQTNIVAYGPVQSNVEAAFVAGKKTVFASQRHGGRPVGTVTVRLAPGETRTVEFIFGKIVQHNDPEVAVTPTIQAHKDVVLKTEAPECDAGP